ncbi:MAG: hypothetical protein JWQ66_2712 [Mucilaginibacter sp.]|nr:hypothetical protein [Mucilaginibacter sp.]
MKNIELQDTAVIASADTTRTQKYSPSIRLWHWSNAIIITGSLLTVLVNSTVLKPWGNASLIADKLKEKGINVSDEQTRSAAFALSDKVWAIHTYFGYALVGLFLFRIAIELLGLADKTLIRKISAAKRSFVSTKANRIATRNEMFIKTSYALFYVLLMVMVTTGLALAFRDNIPLLRSMHFIKYIHGFIMYLILGFIFIHLAGILIGERKRRKGIVSDMINGGASECNI